MNDERTHPFRRGDDRGRLLAAFVCAAAETGLRSVTPAQVTTFAGLPRHSFHRYFDDEDDCLLAAYEGASTWIGGALEDAVAATEDWAEALVAAVAAALALAATDPDLVRLCAIDLRSLDCAAADRLRADLARLAAFLRRGRELCPHGDQMPPSFEGSALGGTLWLLAFHAARGTPAAGPQAHEVTYFLLVPYLGRAEALRAAAAPRPTVPR